MKRAIAWVMMMVCLGAPCLAQTSRTVDEQGALVWLDFDESMPTEAQLAFESVLRQGDRVLCGAMVNRRLQQEAILAAERGGKLLLLGACCPKGETKWRAAVETDSFFEPGTVVDITVEPVYDGLGNPSDRRMYICCGAERYGIGLYESGAMRIESYTRQEMDGSQLCITLNTGWISCDRYTEDLREMLYSARGVMPSRLAAWTHDTFPKDAQGAQQVLEAYTAQTGAGDVFISGGNLRAEPTGSSASWGKYSAKVKAVDSRMGAREPWIQVQIGSLTGWVSRNYVLTAQDDLMRFYSVPSGMTRVARIVEPTMMYSIPDGQEGTVMPSGALLHVLMEKDGWLHVVYPRQEITWQTDWDGAYGFIRAEDAVVGVSIADAMWK